MSEPADDGSTPSVKRPKSDLANTDPTSSQDDAIPKERPVRDEGWRQAQRGRKPGDRYVRAYRPRGFQRIEPGYLLPRPGAGQPKSTVGKAFLSTKRSLIGSPIPTEQE